MTKVASSYYDDESPPGILLLLISFIEQFFLFFNCPKWRDYSYIPTWLTYDLPPSLGNSLPALITYKDYLLQTKSQLSPSTLYTFAFQTSSTSLGNLTSSDSILVLILLVLFLRRVKRTLNPLFCHIGRTLGRKTHGVQWEKDNEEKIIKFGEYVFRLIYHSLFSFYGVIYFWDKPWWDNSRGGTTHLWLGYPHQEIEPGMTWYYMIQCSYNIDAFISLMELSFEYKIQNPFADANSSFRSPVLVSWSKTVRGDFREMLIHHVITNCLVIGSSFFRFTRIGSMVFLVHDISDVPVDMSKLANFVKWTKTTVACFLTMVIVWVITRMIIFPFVIVKSVWYESTMVLVDPSVDVRIFKMYFGWFFSLLVGITCLHYFWFTMFIQIARDLTKGKIRDYTEHKKDKEEDGTSKKVN